MVTWLRTVQCSLQQIHSAAVSSVLHELLVLPCWEGTVMGQSNSRWGEIKYYKLLLREEWEPSPPPSRSSSETQRGETTPGRAMRAEWQTLGSVCHHMWQSQWKSNSRCSFTESPWKRHLIPERWGAAAKAQTFADAVLLNPASSTDSDLWSQRLSLRRHREITLPLPSSKHVAPTRNCTPTPALHSPMGKNTQPSLLSHQEREEHHSWNKGMLDTFWSSWHCSRHYTDQQTRLSKN